MILLINGRVLSLGGQHDTNLYYCTLLMFHVQEG